MKKVTVWTVVLVVALSGVAMAMGPGGGGWGYSGRGMSDHRGMWWDRDQVTEELGLTPKEIDKLDDLHRGHQHSMIDLREDAWNLRRDLAEYLESDSFSVSGAREKYKAMDKIRSEMSEAMFNYRIKQREILGTERFGKLRDRVREHRQERRGGSMHERGSGWSSQGRHMGKY